MNQDTLKVLTESINVMKGGILKGQKNGSFELDEAFILKLAIQNAEECLKKLLEKKDH